ncbi:hypothetical protein [Erythrobacter crassostreae]|uniref:Uncharacterized protein n=1 Tax=Erythrobacter crassostreae TaxID=2828328 RepID=A0A9X1F4T3_9SPHN|nr:hypothetical protein [Erythrobacter crassostrea]MBV7259971.1 hypothetical protein [Erythrobacter crassostrea]
MHYWPVLGVAFLVAVPASADDGPQALPLDNPAYSNPAKPWTNLKEVQATEATEIGETLRQLRESRRACRDRLTTAQDDAPRPVIEPDTASADKPLLIYAVDHRSEGCSLIVMKGNPDDVRQLPELPSDKPLLQRADTDQ